jgi:hypothetical protein
LLHAVTICIIARPKDRVLGTRTAIAESPI